jgi:hypothetical protein
MHYCIPEIKKIFLVYSLLMIVPTISFSQKETNNNIVTPRMRVIVDNDFSGDPDGLFQLTHILLSPSVEIRAIIGSHLKAGDGFDNSKTQVSCYK